MSDNKNVKHISDQEFDSVIGTGVSLVDFWAPWCGPCRSQGPILDRVATAMDGSVKICKINVDENQETARRFNISAIPSIMIFKDGKKVKSFVGLQQESVLVSALQSYLAN
ncbi:MAG: thioredoxin [Candidatus Omnitrophota bacterium]